MFQVQHEVTNIQILVLFTIVTELGNTNEDKVIL